jgi:4a-hydroxytetrahydrobiopterin dehydratase
MKALSKDEIISYLRLHLDNWSFNGSSINRDLEFRNFTDTFSFMTAIALEAEKMDHHPDWKNVYNKLSISLSTHSASGITQSDFDLALKINNTYKKYI